MSLAERRRWAQRQGNHFWLWPEVEISGWRKAQIQIADATSAIFAGQSAGVLTGDPVALSVAAYTSGMGPLLGYWTLNGQLDCDEATSRLLREHFEENGRRMEAFRAATERLINRIAERRIKLVLLKGIHSAYDYFPVPGARPASDIDLLVAANDVDAVRSVLDADNFVVAGEGRGETTYVKNGARTEPSSLLMVHADDPWSFDLHHGLDIYVAAGAPIAALDAAGPLDHAVAWPEITGAYILPQPLLLLHLAVHAGSGLHNLTLLRLVELALVIRRDFTCAQQSWDELLELARKTGSLGYCYPAFALCELLVPGTVPQQVLDQCRGSCPGRGRKIVAGLTPATAQRVTRHSISEHYMWVHGVAGWVRQIASDLAPGRNLHAVKSIYAARLWQVLRGRVSR